MNMKLKIENGKLVGYEREETIIIPDDVTIIGGYAFWGCTNITSVVVSNSVTSIGDFAFWECYDLTSITIPDSVTNIGYNAFLCCYDLVVHCNKGSYAEKYCAENGIKYKTDIE